MRFEIDYDKPDGAKDLIDAAIKSANGDQIVIRTAPFRVKSLGKIVGDALRQQMKELAKNVTVTVEPNDKTHP